MSVVRFRSPELLALAAGQTCTLRLPGCLTSPCVSAHSNQGKHGKGRGVKADDCFIAHACDACHREIDQGHKMTREEKFAAWERGHIETLPRLFHALMRPIEQRPRTRERVRSSLSSSKSIPNPLATARREA